MLELRHSLENALHVLVHDAPKLFHSLVTFAGELIVADSFFGNSSPGESVERVEVLVIDLIQQIDLVAHEYLDGVLRAVLGSLLVPSEDVIVFSVLSNVIYNDYDVRVSINPEVLL